ncbi:hypothetical protein [Aromatoleum diolicum]|uniref:Uncharacterized protein n=1 Tax=Aromatoleum diolicum TaxID=75796 RepID=A0ABX1QF84_9RHOO|nr:hypothetical protein [Aromatoleum diolicum]NMG76635.1 hypothetical protein [Aromatoleum diolicum]
MQQQQGVWLPLILVRKNNGANIALQTEVWRCMCLGFICMVQQGATPQWNWLLQCGIHEKTKMLTLC